MNVFHRIYYWLFPSRRPVRPWVFPQDTEAQQLIETFDKLKYSIADDDERMQLDVEKAASEAWDKRLKEAGGRFGKLK